MRLCVYNYVESDIPLHHESQVLKTAYLFAQNLMSAGTSPCLFFMQQIGFDQKTMRKKVEFLIRMADANGWMEQLQTFREVEHMLKKHQQIKHPSPKIIAAFRQFEQGFNQMYTDTVQGLGDQPYCAHYNMLLPLLEPGLFDTTAAYLEDPEGTGENHEPLSSFFLDEQKAAEPDKSYLFCLTPDFVTSGPGAALRIAEEAPLTAPFITPLFSLPNLNALSIQELKVLRDELKPAALPFQAAVQQWATACHRAIAGPAAHSALIRSEVLPAAASFATALSESRTLKPYQHLPDKVEVLVGLAPVGLIWKHLHDCKAIPDVTWDVLKEREESGKTLELFFCTRHHIPDVAVLRNFTEDHAAAVTKRSLVID